MKKSEFSPFTKGLCSALGLVAFIAFAFAMATLPASIMEMPEISECRDAIRYAAFALMAALGISGGFDMFRAKEANE